MIKCDICIDSTLKPCFNALFHTISVTLREAENNIIMTKLRFRKCKWPEIWQRADPGLKSRLSEAQSGAIPPWRGRTCRDRSVLSHLRDGRFLCLFPWWPRKRVSGFWVSLTALILPDMGHAHILPYNVHELPSLCTSLSFWHFDMSIMGYLTAPVLILG